MDASKGDVKPMENESLANAYGQRTQLHVGYPGMMNGIANGSPRKEHKSPHKHKDKERDRHKSSHKDKDRHSSHKSSHKDRHRDQHKDKHRSKDDKHRSRDDKHRDKSKDHDRHRDKEKRSSSSGEKRDRDKDRRHSSHKSSHKDKHRESSSSVKVEQYAEEFVKKENFPTDSQSSQEDFKLVKQEHSKVKEEIKPVKQERTIVTEEMLDSEEDEHQLVIKEEESYIPAKEEDEDYEAEEEGDDDYEAAEEDEDDMPLASRNRANVSRVTASRKRSKMKEESDEDDIPLISRKKVKAEKKELDDDFKTKKPVAKRKLSREVAVSPMKKKKKLEDDTVWKWWEEEKKDDGVKWKYLEHKGPVFAPEYERIPSSVKFYYKGEHMKLGEGAEEVAGFYARMIDHDYTTKDIFNSNFFKDWRKAMTAEERAKIVDLKKCDFRKLQEYFLQKTEERKNRTKEEKKELKVTNENLIADYGWCMIDKHKQRIGNFRIEPPGLFRGRGEHPKMGKLKRRVIPEDVMINCSKDSVIPKPPAGRKWKEVRHDSAVTWLACWVENVQNQTKYVMLNAASKLKGEKDWQKYETARRLHKIVDRIRENYRADFKSKEMRVRQRAVALYFIDKLALRAGNEKDEDQADTVGCCSLRVEHITLTEEKDGMEYVVAFDFLGKDSIRYYNEVPVEKRVFKNLQLFMENKQGGDDLFDRLNTQIMNKHLNELMDQLTAKVFRTYNASRTLQEQLEKLTEDDDSIPQKILSYNRANREVAILCNHQRAVPKTFEKSMANLQQKIDDKKEQLQEDERHLRDLKKSAKHGGSVKDKMLYDKKRKAMERTKDQLYKLEISATDKEENKQIALGTSKLNYLDPRISVAWCKKNNVPIEKIYNKTHRQKFQWAIDMATAEYNFMGNPMAVPRNSQDDEDDEEDEDDDDV